MTTVFDGVAPLAHLGVIRVQGDDAASFLHNQLTQDFALMGASEARLAAFCTAKGRVLASFVALRRSPGDILLVCHQDLLAPTLKRLSMFVLRAKARLSDASAELSVVGLAGRSVSVVAGSVLGTWKHQDLGSGAHAVGLPPHGDVALALWVGPAGSSPPDQPALDTALWNFAQLRSGVVLVSAATAEAFVPQMLNYESVGGVNFKKGCYPGQEVVARSQFRGTLKRRAFLIDSAVARRGDSLFTEDDADQPCATVVQAAANPEGGFAALVSGQVSAMQTPVLHVRAANGPPARTAAVPYALLEDL